jgi:hypothetical protein
MDFGTDTYRAGAMERVEDALLLSANEHFVGAVYSAGLAVECMLRSLVWIKDKQLDERHDLRRLAVRIESLGLLRRGEADEGFVGLIQDIAVGWHNNLRFAAEEQLVRLWTHVGMVRKKKSGKIKTECENFLNQCSEAIKRCEVLWQRHRKSSSKRS